MSTIKLDIQKFNFGSAPEASWSSGITVTAVQAALASFNNEIQATIDAIKNYTAVDDALHAGWSGKDCETYLAKFHEHAEDVCSKIEVYKEAVAKEAESIISQWEEFQSGLIS